MNKFIQPLFLLLFLGLNLNVNSQDVATVSVSDDQNGPRDGFDVTYYQLDLDLDIVHKKISGTVDIYFTALTNLDTLHINLYRNLEIENILQDSVQLKFSRQNANVYVKLNKKLSAGEQGKIAITYKGKPESAVNPPWKGGLVWSKDYKSRPWIGVACQTAGASIWWPVKDDLRDEPDSVLFQMAIHKGLTCISNGKLIKREEKGDKEVFTWKTRYPINVYNVTFYIGYFEHFTIPYSEKDSSKILDFYVLEKNLNKAKELFQMTVPIIHFFEETFGEYPWWDEGYKLIDSPYAGMEHQTAIAYGGGFGSNDRDGVGFDYLILHETAHEWWGNSVSVGDFKDIWLQEGFATYCEFLYIENIRGYQAYKAYVTQETRGISNYFPIGLPFKENELGGFDSDVYSKGALILHSLRCAIEDDSVFFDILKTFYQEQKYSITSTDEFVEVVNRKTGKDYQHFFDVYLNYSDPPILQWRHVRKKKKGINEFKYRWKAELDSLQIPVELQLPEEIIKIYPSKETQILRFKDDNFIGIRTKRCYYNIEEVTSL